jgi:hypothetical protein
VRLLRDPAERLRLGMAARARALQNFTLDQAVDAFDGIYDHLGALHLGSEATVVLPAPAMADARIPLPRLNTHDVTVVLPRITDPDATAVLARPDLDATAVLARPELNATVGRA